MGRVRSTCLGLVGWIGLVLTLCTVRTYYFLDQGAIVWQGEESQLFDVNDESWLRFGEGLRFPTVAWNPHNTNTTASTLFLRFLFDKYRELFASDYVTHEVINRHSLLVTVQGTDPRSLPYLLMGHYDVVPAEVDKWSVDPFASVTAGNRVYARGAIDCKLIVFGILEALLKIVKSGGRPKKSFLISFGHDEEVGGLDGAAQVARRLREKGIDKVEYILDEGMPILRGMIPGLEQDIAVIGVTEKGFISLNISVSTKPGHSSIPSAESSIGIISRAVHRLETNPMPAKVDDVTKTFFETIGRKMYFPLNVVFTNFWIFRPLITWLLKLKPDTASMIRTTTAVSMIGGGTKTNVLPSHAWAVINFRIHTISNIDQVLESVRATINDERVKISVIEGFEAINPAAISPHEVGRDAPITVVKKSIKQVHNHVLSAPGTMVANTDTKHFTNFTKHIFRHFPIILTRSDVATIHGHDENVSRENFAKAVNFYHRVITNSDSTDFNRTNFDWSDKYEL